MAVHVYLHRNLLPDSIITTHISCWVCLSLCLKLEIIILRRKRKETHVFNAVRVKKREIWFFEAYFTVTFIVYHKSKGMHMLYYFLLTLLAETMKNKLISIDTCALILWIMVND